MIQHTMRLAGLLLLLCPLTAPAQMEVPSSQYVQSLNSMVTGAPESAQMMKYIDYPVSYFTGTPQISFPIAEVAGKAISIPVNLSYHAGGGIKIDDQAGNQGLGWSLSTGGEISREIRGIADDLPTKGFIYKNKPVSYYESIRPKLDNDPVALAHFAEWEDVAEGNMDLEPDIYYFNFGPYSGKFMYDEIQGKFVNLNSKDRVLKITLAPPGSAPFGFTVIADDGTRFIFSNAEYSSVKNFPIGQPPSGPTPPQITSWKLSKIINADVTDSIMLNYDYNISSYYTDGSSTAYQVINGGASRAPTLNVYSKSEISGTTKLKSIVSRTDSVSFQYETLDRLDYPAEHAIARIFVCSKGGPVKDIFRFHTSYYNRESPIGIDIGILALKSLRLDSLSEYGNSESNTNPLRHRFTYNSTALPGRLSFAKDMWGYANYNTYTQHLAAPMYMSHGAVPLYLAGADRTPNAQKMKAGILEKVELPTGGSISFEYEPHTVSNPTLLTTANTVSEMHVITSFKGPGEQFDPTYKDSFTISQVANPAINGNMGGVIASIGIGPDRQGSSWGGPLYSDHPVFKLTRAANPPLSPNQPPFYGVTIQGPPTLSNVYLPDGKYYIEITGAGTLNTPQYLNNIRSLYMGVSFSVSDSSASANQYMAGGLRIKSITKKDNFTNTSSVRNFIYDDPVTDSAYGKLIGPGFYRYYETRISTGDQFFVRMGNNALPGQGSLGAHVVYPKVIEEVRDSGKTYRTEHYYLNVMPDYINSFPFTPFRDNEYARGKEIATFLKRSESTGFTTAKRSAAVYEYNPPLLPYDQSLSIQAIKCVIDQYSGGITGFPMFTITPYSNIFSYAYLTSDSSFSYDGGPTNPLTLWNSYTYGEYNNLPLTITSKNSKGQLLVQKNGYAMDAAESALATAPALASQLSAANRISQALASRTYKDGSLLNQAFYKGHFSGSRFLMDSVLQSEYDYPLEVQGKILDYDDQANPLTLEGRGNQFRKYIWRKERNLALATCTMPVKSNFVFTSFEYPGEYSTIQEGNRTTAYNFSGKYAYYLNGSLIFQGFNAPAGLEVYAWTTQGNFAANGIAGVSTGRTKGAWTLYKASIPNYATVTVSGTLVLDQLVIIPKASTFEANVFDEADRVTAKISQDLQTTFFEYDAFSRLNIVRDEKGNIVKSNNYNYQVAE